jgi:hypothetical protein
MRVLTTKQVRLKAPKQGEPIDLGAESFAVLDPDTQVIIGHYHPTGDHRCGPGDTVDLTDAADDDRPD